LVHDVPQEAPPAKELVTIGQVAGFARCSGEAMPITAAAISANGGWTLPELPVPLLPFRTGDKRCTSSMFNKEAGYE
jgi:hypothetical protein